MTNKPTLSPIEALNRHRESGQDAYEHEGFDYTLDGCQGSPREEWASFAEDKETEAQWFASGELGEDVTEASEWVLAD
jgi:hypothetical protein